jgi:SMC interacting uncharacterized protein involved in chromosome segregation
LEEFLKTWDALRENDGRATLYRTAFGTISVPTGLTDMEDTRIDRLEGRLDELAVEMRTGFRAVETRLCKIEARLDQMATNAELRAIEARLESRLDQCATKAELGELRTEMYRMNAELKTWMLATMVTIIATSLAATFGLHHWSS